MANSINTNFDTPQQDGQKSEVVEKLNTPQIAQTIGRGEDARNSFIYLTLRWSFIAGVVISGVIALNYWIFAWKTKVPDFVGDIKIVWEILVPIITLALGYAFGRSKD